MAESRPEPKKKVSFGKAYVRVLLNYRGDSDSMEETPYERLSRLRQEKQKHERDARGKSSESEAGSQTLPVGKKRLATGANTQESNTSEDHKRADFSSKGQAKRGEEETKSSHTHAGIKSILKRKENDRQKSHEDRRETSNQRKMERRETSDKRSVLSKKISSRKTKNMETTETNKVKKPDRTVKNSVEKRTQDTPKVKSIEKSQEIRANPKQRVVTNRERLQRSSDGIQTTKNEKSIKKDRDSTVVKEEENVRDNEIKNPDKAGEAKTKDTEKWPGVRDLDPMNLFQGCGGVYSGVEANWKETKESLSKIGVDVAEDKLQNPSEFIAVMNILLGLKNTAKKYHKPNDAASLDTNGNAIQPELVRKTDPDLPDGNGVDGMKKDSKGPLKLELNGGMRMKNGGYGQFENASFASEMNKDTRGQVGKRKRAAKGGTTGSEVTNLKNKKKKGKGMKRSYSEGSLDTGSNPGTLKDIGREEYSSESDLRKISRSEDLKSTESGKWQNIMKSFWQRIKKKKRNDEVSEDKKDFSEKNPRGTENDLQETQVEDNEKQTLLMIAQYCQQSHDEGTDLPKPEKIAHVREDSADEEESDGITSDACNVAASLRGEIETRQDLEELSAIDGVHKNLETNKTDQMGKDRKAGIVSEPEEASPVGEANLAKETDQLEKSFKAQTAGQPCESSKDNQSSEIDKASQVGQSVHSEGANGIEECSDTRKANQVEEPSHEVQTSQVHDSSYSVETSQERDSSHMVETSQITEYQGKTTQAIQTDQSEVIVPVTKQSDVKEFPPTEKRCEVSCQTEEGRNLTESNQAENVNQIEEDNSMKNADNVPATTGEDGTCESNKVSQTWTDDQTETKWEENMGQINTRNKMNGEVVEIREGIEVRETTHVDKSRQTETCDKEGETNRDKNTKTTRKTGMTERNDERVEKTSYDFSIILDALARLPGYEVCYPLGLQVIRH